MPGINDYKKFPFKEISCGPSHFSFITDKEKESAATEILKNVEYQYRNETIRSSLDELLRSTGTNTFIIIQNDTIVCEKYFNRYTRESINSSFSVAKSFVSSLVGIAIDEGLITSIEDRVADYLPELKNKVSETLSINHLISMASGIRYNPSHYPWADEPMSYHYPDLRKLVLKAIRQDYQPGTYFQYSNYNTILLGIILERVTKMPPYEYLQEKIWKPIGMQFPASWSTDNCKTHFPKMESGINARGIDYAKFGRLFLNSGQWENKLIINKH